MIGLNCHDNMNACAPEDVGGFSEAALQQLRREVLRVTFLPLGVIHRLQQEHVGEDARTHWILAKNYQVLNKIRMSDLGPFL